MYLQEPPRDDGASGSVNFLLDHCMKDYLFSNLFTIAVHTAFLSETQALILLSTTECTHS